MKLSLQIAAGIVLAVLVLVTIFVVGANKAAEQAMVELQRASEAASTRQAEQLRRLEQQRQARLAQQRRAQELALANQQMKNRQEVAARVSAAAKDQAWREHYKAPAKCLNASDMPTQVECGNHYMRAKRAFEASYQS